MSFVCDHEHAWASCHGYCLRHVWSCVTPRAVPSPAQALPILRSSTGVWVNDAPGYAKFVGMLADYLHLHAATLPVVVWRDSSSQHFDNPTGDFGCVPEKGCWAPQHSYPFVCQARQARSSGGCSLCLMCITRGQQRAQLLLASRLS